MDVCDLCGDYCENKYPNRPSARYDAKRRLRRKGDDEERRMRSRMGWRKEGVVEAEKGKRTKWKGQGKNERV